MHIYEHVLWTQEKCSIDKRNDMEYLLIYPLEQNKTAQLKVFSRNSFRWNENLLLSTLVEIENSSFVMS